jgi:hypothetical protein
LFRILGIVAVCLALGACAQGRMSLSTPSDRGLAAQGWQEGHLPDGSLGAGVRLSKALICATQRCGGIGYVAAGTAPMPASSAAGFLVIMTNPSLTNRQLLTAMQRVNDETHAFSRMGGQVTDVRRGRNSIHIGVTYSQYIAGAGKVFGLGTADVTADSMSLVVAAGPTAASARQRLRMAH